MARESDPDDQHGDGSYRRLEPHAACFGSARARARVRVRAGCERAPVARRLHARPGPSVHAIGDAAPASASDHFHVRKRCGIDFTGLETRRTVKKTRRDDWHEIGPPPWMLRSHRGRHPQSICGPPKKRSSGARWMDARHSVQTAERRRFDLHPLPERTHAPILIHPDRVFVPWPLNLTVFQML